MRFIISVLIILIIGGGLYFFLSPNLEEKIERSAKEFDIESLNLLYAEKPDLKEEIDDYVIQYWGARVDTSNFNNLSCLIEDELFSIIHSRIELRRKALIEDYFSKLNSETEFEKLISLMESNPNKYFYSNKYIEEVVFTNIEKYSYDELSVLYGVIQYDDELKSDLELVLLDRETDIFNKLERLSFKKLNKYYHEHKNQSKAIDIFLSKYVMPSIDEYDYFELKQISELLSFSEVVNEINNLKNVKRRQVIVLIKKEIEEMKMQEDEAFYTYNVEMKEAVDNYFYPAYQNFSDEYFDFGSDIKRFFKSIGDLFSDEEYIVEYFLRHWETYINNDKIREIIVNRGEPFRFYIEKGRLAMMEDIFQMIDKDFEDENIATIDKFYNVEFKEGRKISKSFASKSALIGTGSMIVEGGAAVFTGGQSLWITRGVNMVGSTAVSIKNENEADAKFIGLYENQMAKLIQSSDSIFSKSQEVFYNNLMHELNENL